MQRKFLTGFPLKSSACFPAVWNEKYLSKHFHVFVNFLPVCNWPIRKLLPDRATARLLGTVFNEVSFNSTRYSTGIDISTVNG